MASLVARAAVGAASLPSGRARHLGSGRLSLAALPGHGAVVLAGRRDVTGRAGVLAVVLKVSSRVGVGSWCSPSCIAAVLACVGSLFGLGPLFKALFHDHDREATDA
jgi:hypothetical protein